MAKNNFTRELETMEVGDVREYPIENLRSVRAQASELGSIWQKKFSTRKDEERRVVMVTRER